MKPDGLARYTPTLSGDTRVLCVSLDSAMAKHVGDALTNLTNIDEWYEDGDTIADVIAAASVTVEDYYNQMLVGSVLPWLINPPNGWLLLDGSTYALADYPELAAVLPTHLVSSPNFTLPDVELGFPFGVLDEADGSQVSGSNTFNLTEAQLPSHTHTYTSVIVDIDVKTLGAPDPAGARLGPPVATGATGSGDDIDGRPLRFGLVYAVFAGRNG